MRRLHLCGLLRVAGGAPLSSSVRRLRHMFDNSVIKRTGQWWKLVVGYCILLIGGATMLFARSLLGHVTAEVFALVMVAGTVVVFFGVCFGVVLVKCPRCHKHWVWSAMKGQNANRWVGWLLSQRNCPACLFPDGIAKSSAELAAAPNGGPAKRLGNSGAGAGPPSVS